MPRTVIPANDIKPEGNLAVIHLTGGNTPVFCWPKTAGESFDWGGLSGVGYHQKLLAAYTGIKYKSPKYLNPRLKASL